MGINAKSLGKGLKESIDPRGCKIKGVQDGYNMHSLHTELGKRVKGVYRPKRLLDEGVGRYKL
jgi:hypothetical protein